MTPIRTIIFAVALTFGCNNQAPEKLSEQPDSEVRTVRPKNQKRLKQTPSEHLETLKNRPIPELGSKTTMSDEDFQSLLSDEEFKILRKQGTERAFSGEYNDHKEVGTYHCRACNAPLYTSETKFDSRTGWPSFWDAIEGRVETRPDNSYGMTRTEIVCAHCDSHLGHVFDDGPEPTGLRHCANSLSLVFHPETP